MNNAAQKAYSMSDYDKVNSTFRHEISLNPEGFFYDKKKGIYRKNSLLKLAMYSKKVGFDEQQDKTRLLEQEVARLVVTNKYFEVHEGIPRTNKIVLIQNIAIADVNIVIAELYPNTYRLNRESKYANAELIKFLDSLYDVLSGKGSELLIKRKSKPAQSMDMYDLSARYSSHDHLIQYCDNLVKQGEERGRVEGYWRKVKELNPQWFVKKETA